MWLGADDYDMADSEEEYERLAKANREASRDKENYIFTPDEKVYEDEGGECAASQFDQVCVGASCTIDCVLG